MLFPTQLQQLEDVLFEHRGIGCISSFLRILSCAQSCLVRCSYIYIKLSRTTEASGFSCFTPKTPALQATDFATASEQANEQCLMPLPSEYGM